MAGAALREVFTGVVEDALGTELSCLLDAARAAEGVRLRASALATCAANVLRRRPTHTVDDDELPGLPP
jgi:hypothetical protein